MKRKFLFVVLIALMVIAIQLPIFVFAGYLSAEEVHFNTTITTPASEKWYKIIVPSKGFINVSTVQKLTDSGTYKGYFCIYSTDAQRLLMNYNAYQVYANENITSGDIGVDAGTYYVMWHSYYYGTDLRVTFTADENCETEYNGGRLAADVIPVNKAISGRIATGSDEDWFKFVLQKDGLVNLSFEHEIVEANDKEEWTMSLYMGEDTSEFSTMYITNNKNYKSSDIALKAGTYYISIESYGSNSYVDCPYKLTALFEEFKEPWETEPNSEFVTAQDMKLNSSYNGSITNSYDKDWFRFEIPERGTLKWIFKHQSNADTMNYFKVKCLSDDGVTSAVSSTQEVYCDIQGNEEEVSSCEYGLEKGTYYFKISSGYKVDNSTYTISTVFTPCDNFEIEANDEMKEATMIDANKQIKGNASYSGDTDWYVLNLEKSSNVTFSVTTSAEEAYFGSFFFLTSDGATEFVDKYVISGKSISFSSELSAGKYYVKAVGDWNNYGSYALVALVNHTHTFGEWQITKSPTCRSEGVNARFCSVCGCSEEKSIPIKEHSVTQWETETEPTCTEEGVKYGICSECGDTCYETIPQTGHHWGKETKSSGSIFDYPIIMKSTCTRCGKSNYTESYKGRWILPTIIACVVLAVLSVTVIVVIKIKKSKAPIVCPHCGKTNDKGSLFCIACGKEIK